MNRQRIPEKRSYNIGIRLPFDANITIQKVTLQNKDLSDLDDIPTVGYIPNELDYIKKLSAGFTVKCTLEKISHSELERFLTGSGKADSEC
jgi:hypothetical protein